MSKSHVINRGVLALQATLTLAILTVGARAQVNPRITNPCPLCQLNPYAGIFTIASVNSGLVLDVPAWSNQPGTRIQQWPENDGANQQWAIRRPVNSPGFEIASVNSGLVLDVPAWSTQPGALIQQWTQTGGANQLWTIRAKGGDAYEIVSVYSGLVLDVPAWSTQPGTQVQQWTENGGANQQWTFRSLGTASISVMGQRNQTGGYITITGQGLNPGPASLYVYYLGVPRQQGIVSGTGPAGVAGDGTFSITDTVYFTSSNYYDAFGYVTVAVVDGSGNVLAIGYIGAGYWVS